MTKICEPTPFPTGKAKTVKAKVVSAMVSEPSPNAYFARACINNTGHARIM